MKLDFSYDEERDVFTIEGVQWCGDLLRAVGVNGLPIGAIIRIEKREDGAVTLMRLYDPEKCDEYGKRLPIC